MKIGIMTYFRPINYGAFLQAYALSHRLNQEEDIDAEIIDFYMPEEDEFYERQLKFGKNILRVMYNRRRFKTFRDALKEQILSESNCCSSSIQEFITFVRNKYDIIIAGSDEIWKVNGHRGFPTPYFLPGDLRCKKVSYAASGRTSFSILPENDRDLLSQYFNDFDYIGVRDCKTAKDIEEVIAEKIKVHLNFDPSLVYKFSPDLERGQNLLKKYFHLSGRRKVIAVMYSESQRSKPNLESYMKKTFGERYDFISLYNWSFSLKNSPRISPLDWVDLIAAVDGVITMYFHGICFSIIAGTPFYAIEKIAKNNEESKLYDFLSRIGFLDYYSLGLEDAITKNKLEGFIDMLDECGEIDFSAFLNEARDDFDKFLQVLRKIDGNN